MKKLVNIIEKYLKNTYFLKKSIRVQIRAHSGIKMLPFDTMAVKMKGKPRHQMMMDYSIHEVGYLNFIAPTSFLKILDYSSYRYFFMCEGGKCPKHCRSE